MLYKIEAKMEKEELDSKIVDAAKMIMSFSRSRTRNDFDAEDLAQDIVCELYRSRTNIKSDGAFYGFMWSVAENVSKAFARKRYRTSVDADGNDIEYIADADAEGAFDAIADGDERAQNILRLRRELSLLSEKYRRAAVLYYIRGMTCAEVSRALSVSESMVKYLLFKSRRKLLEGFYMERNYGKQSYDPKRLSVHFWGGFNRVTSLCESMLAQNILCACYNDKLTEQQISLEIGVSLPYMEDMLKRLCENALVVRDGNRYTTNFTIFDDALLAACARVTGDMASKAADVIESCIRECEEKIRGVGFYGCDMSKNTYAWQTATILIRRAMIYGMHDPDKLEYSRDPLDENNYYIVWGEETDETVSRDGFDFGHCIMQEGSSGAQIKFFDFPCNGEYVHHYFYDHGDEEHMQHNMYLGVLFNITRGDFGQPSKNDEFIAADMVKHGYILSDGGVLRPNFPVMKKEEECRVLDIIEPYAARAVELVEGSVDKVARVIADASPSHLRSRASTMAHMKLFDDTVSQPVRELWERGVLLRPAAGEMLPTTYAVL